MKDKTKLFDIVLIAIIVLAVLFVFRVASPHPLAASSQPAAASAADPEQLWQEKAQAKNKPKSTQEQEAITILRNDPQMRAAFIGKIAAPIANKMFECGMIP